MSWSTKITAARIQRYAETMGLSVERDASNVSESRYLTISDSDTYVKVRVSAHILPPSYSAPDYEVGPHPMGASWAPVLAAIAKHFSRVPPPAVRKFCRRLEKIALLRKEVMAAQQAELSAAADQRMARDIEIDRLLALYPTSNEAVRLIDLRARLGAVTGIDGRKARHIKEDIRRAERNLLLPE